MTDQTATDTAAERIRAFLDAYGYTHDDVIIPMSAGFDRAPKLAADDLETVLHEHATMTAELAELKAERADTGTTHRELLARTYCAVCGGRKTSLAHLNECLSAEGAS